MRVVEIADGFGLDHLVVGQREEPAAGPGRLLLHMRAASLNYRDLQFHEPPQRQHRLCRSPGGETPAVLFDILTRYRT